MASIALRKERNTVADLRSKLAKKGRLVKQYGKVAVGYAPSITNTATVIAGGGIAGVINTDQFIPSEIAGMSSNLIIGGVLASYGIFATGNQSKTDNAMGRIAVNIGNGMIAVWVAEFAQNQLTPTSTGATT
jgi:hypothetical protein